MRALRSELYSVGLRQRKFAVEPSYVRKLDELKAQYKLNTRDIVINRLIRQAAALYEPSSYSRQEPETQPERATIVLNLHHDNNEYVKAVHAILRSQGKSRVGHALELIMNRISDLEQSEIQLSLDAIWESQENVVSR